jgi:PAS domain S-box-containing protein
MQSNFRKLFRPLLFLIAVVLLLNFFGYYLFQPNKQFYHKINQTIEIIGDQKAIVNTLTENKALHVTVSDSLAASYQNLKQTIQELSTLAKDKNRIFLSSLFENYNVSYSQLQHALFAGTGQVTIAKNAFIVASDNLLNNFKLWSVEYYTFNEITPGKFISLFLAIIALMYLILEPLIRNYRSNKSNLLLTKSELLKEKVYLSSILNSQTNFILRLNDSFQLNYVNPAFIKKFKYNADNIHLLTFYDLVQPKDLYRCRQILEECIHRPQQIFTLKLEIPVVGEDEKLWTSWEFINLSSPEENTSEIQVLGIDINEKYYAEKGKEELLRTKTFALTHAKMGSWKYNFLTRDLRLSREMLKVFGIDAPGEQTISLDSFLNNYVPQKYHHKILDEIVKAISSKALDKESNFTFEIINAQQQTRWFYVSGKLIDKTTAFGIAQDITNQKRSADALIESNFKFKLLADNADDIIAITNQQGFFTYVSPSIEKALGYQPREIQHEHFSSIIHVEDFDKINWNKLKNFQKNTEPQTLRFKVLSKSQFYIWFECIIKPLFQDGDIQFICSARNITKRTIVETEREQLLEEIKQSEELLRTVINSTPDWMYIKDTGQRYLLVNKSYAEQMQLPAMEFIGRTELELNLPYIQKHITPNLISDNEVLKTGVTKFTLEETFHIGERPYTMTTIRIPLFSADKSIWGVLCIAHNISEIKEAQHKLLYKDKLLQAVADATYELIRNADLDTALKTAVSKLGAQLNIANIGVYSFNHSAQLPNDSTKCILNWKGNQVDPFSRDEAIPLLTVSPVYKTLEQKKFFTGRCNTISDPIVKNYLTQNHIETVTFMPLFVMNELWGFVSFTNKENIGWSNTEISILQSFTESIAASIERKNVEKQLIDAKNNAELANTVKSSFLANTTHELKSPLNSIIGFTDLVIKSDVNKSQKEFLQNVKKSATDLQQMINNILDYSNLESGTLALKAESFMLEDFMTDVFDIYQLHALDKNVNFTSFADPGLPTKIVTDSFRLREILFHLLNNAFKFTPAGEDVIISVKTVGNIVHESGKAMQKIAIKIKDTGYGISPKKLKTIFDSFSQANSNVNRPHGGMGLGLSISKRLAELMNGELSVESEMGKGAAFTLTLNVEVLVPEPLYLNNLPIGIKKALIIEKNKHTAHYIKTTLEYFNIPVVCTENTEEAVLYLTENAEINLVLVDQYIDQNKGIEFIQRVNRELKFPMHQCILMMPALENNLYEQQAGNAGISNILSKPVKTYELYGLLFSAAMEHSPNDVSYEDAVNKAIIMVVEDDEINRMLIEKVLNGLGFEVIAVSSGKDCLEQITSIEPVLVFLDLNLPVMDGFTTARLIRKLKSPYCNIPIVAISSSDSAQDRQKCNDVAINDFISKPYRYEDIVKVLKQRTLLV